MEITKIEKALPYEAPGHFDMRGLRLQGFDASSATFAWTGLSHFLPGGGAEMDTSPLEKIYVVLDGEVTVTLGTGEVYTLSTLDSCFIPGGEAREIENKSNRVASMLVIMPYPEDK